MCLGPLRSRGVGLAETDDDIEPVNDDVAILAEFAKVLSNSCDIEGEVVDGGNEISDPVSTVKQEPIHQLIC